VKKKLNLNFSFIACLSVLCGFGDSVNIECSYGPWTLNVMGPVYQCFLENTLNITSRESAVINSETGYHLKGMSNANVTCFFSDDYHVIEYFPRNLKNIFINLNMIYIHNGPLKEIHQNDLRPFPNLLQLGLSYNDIEYLEDGLFDYNPELAYISIESNKIIHIGSQVFENLNKLSWLYLQDNTCIDMVARNNRAAVRKVINKAKSSCQQSDLSQETATKSEISEYNLNSSVNIECEYYTSYWNDHGPVYTCEIQNTLNITSRESAVIHSETGYHVGYESNDDVTCFWSVNALRVIEYFPRNLENIFTNLKIIKIAYGRLKEIKQSDLKPFSNLVFLGLEYNDIKFLEDGLFAYNPELTYINLYGNKITHIGIQVFENLNKLSGLYLGSNTCINTYSTNHQRAVREVIKQAKVRCQHYSESSKSTTNYLNVILIGFSIILCLICV